MYKEIDINFVLYHCIQGELISLCYADKVHYDDNYNAFICHGIERESHHSCCYGLDVVYALAMC